MNLSSSYFQLTSCLRYSKGQRANGIWDLGLIAIVGHPKGSKVPKLKYKMKMTQLRQLLNYSKKNFDLLVGRIVMFISIKNIKKLPGLIEGIKDQCLIKRAMGLNVISIIDFVFVKSQPIFPESNLFYMQVIHFVG